MKIRFERWTTLPFFMGCSTSKSSAVIDSTSCVKRLPSSLTNERAKSSSSLTRRNSFRLFRLRKLNIGYGIHRLFRSLTHVCPRLAYKSEEKEMEIGYPTDVKHLTHIGLNGSITTIDSVKGEESRGSSDNNTKGSEKVTLPSVSLEQLEMAMAAQAYGYEHQAQKLVAQQT